MQALKFISSPGDWSVPAGLLIVIHGANHPLCHPNIILVCYNYNQRFQTGTDPVLLMVSYNMNSGTESLI